MFLDTLLRLLCRLSNPNYQHRAIVFALDILLAHYHEQVRAKTDDPKKLDKLTLQRMAVDFLLRIANTRAEQDYAGSLRLIPEFETALLELRKLLGKHKYG